MRRLLCGLSACLASGTAAAQNTSGVTGPVVNAGHRAAEYRLAFAPGEGGAPDAYAHRFHYEQALDGHRMARLVLQTNDTQGQGAEFSYLQGQFFWELSSDEDAWKRAFRFDARLTGGGGPHELRVSFANQWALTDRLSARLMALAGVEAGDGRKDGITLASRAWLAYDLDPDVTIGVETLNPYGSTSDLSRFGVSNHQAGPFVSAGLGQDWAVAGRVLFGLSDAAPDTDFRFELERRF